jgi:recombination protein RecA
MLLDKKREERLRRICDSVQKTFGGKEAKGEKVINYIGSSEFAPLERFSSGSIELDEALGGGWPRGRMIEIYGPESGGKTTTCYHAIAEFQKKFPDDDIAWIDSEYSLDPDYAGKIGVDVSTLLHQQPTDGNQAFEIIRHLIRNGVKLIIVDSVAALSPSEEIEASMEDTQRLGSAARMMSQALRVLVSEAGSTDTTIIFTNQIRDKPGVMWGEKTTTPGGRALRFYASIRVDVRSVGQEKDGEVVTSMQTKALVKKNKTAAPLRIANFVISFGVGIDRVAGIFDKGLEREIIVKSGSWMSYMETRIGQGRAAAIQFLRDNPDVADEIAEKIAATPAPASKKKDFGPKKVKKGKRSEDSEDAEEVPVEEADSVPVVAESGSGEEVGGTTVDDV